MNVATNPTGEAMDEMAEAVLRQAQRHAASMRVDRRDWTDSQWVEDARRLMDEVDGAVTSLVNGHVLALLDELAKLEAVAKAARRAIEDPPGTDWWFKLRDAFAALDRSQRVAPSPTFCAAAAEWDHSWQVVEIKSDGTAIEECSECQERVADPFYDPGPNS